MKNKNWFNMARLVFLPALLVFASCPHELFDATEGVPFAVTVDKPALGSITASHTQAVSGTDITVTVTDKIGSVFVPGSIFVNGGEIPVTQKDAWSFTFTMPPKAVFVTADFIEDPAVPADQIHDFIYSNGEVTSDLDGTHAGGPIQYWEGIGIDIASTAQGGYNGHQKAIEVDTGTGGEWGGAFVVFPALGWDLNLYKTLSMRVKNPNPTPRTFNFTLGNSTDAPADGIKADDRVIPANSDWCYITIETDAFTPTGHAGTSIASNTQTIRSVFMIWVFRNASGGKLYFDDIKFERN